MVSVSRIFSPAFALFAAGCSALSSYEQNGVSTYGTTDNAPLPMQLGPQTNPWGSNSQPSSQYFVPNTGKTRTYNFVVSRAIKSPDGYNKSVILINNQFPGPLIEANWGDTIVVNVQNNIDSVAEGLTLHWHGQPQRLNPSQDGVPGISQCPIPPGSSYTYRFRAESFGTSWYHSHVSGQYTDGLYGPMVIYGPSQAWYDIDLGPIMLSDYSHTSYYDILKLGYQLPPVFSNVDNNLINGKGQYNCSLSPNKACNSDANLATFNFYPNKVHRLRLINTGGSGTQKFTIDGHSFTVIANDYVPVVPYKTNVITLGIGQRTDVLVKGIGAPKSLYWMRSDLDLNCLNLTSSVSNAKAIIRYPGAPQNTDPSTTATPWSSNNCANDPLSQTTPFWPLHPTQPDVTQVLAITVGVNGTNLLFFVNGVSFEGNYNEALLADAAAGNTLFSPQRSVYNFGTSKSIRIVIYNEFPMVHPIHIHGHDAWVVAEGVGVWDNITTTNSRNPQRRDTQLLQPASPSGQPGYIVLQFNADNPGIWPLHCHTSIHVSAGLLVNVMERPDKIKGMQLSSNTGSNCQAWNTWASTHTVDQIDSGL